jgi:uncharacterized protein
MTTARPTEPLRRPREALDPRVRRWWATHCLLWGAGLGLCLLVTGLLTAGDTSWWFTVPGVVGIVGGLATAAALPPYWYRIHRWEVDDDAVYARSGYLWVEWRSAPLSRIQTVDTRRGPIQQLFGLASLVVTTASTRGAVVVAGLAEDRATELAETLTRETQAVPGDAT